MTHYVVVGYDGTKRGRAAVSKAIDLAARERCDIVVVCTHERPADFSNAPFLLGRLDESAWVREWEQQTQEDLRHEIMRIRLAGVDAVAECSLDDPADLLHDLAEELDADYIVVPDDSEGVLADLIVGSMAQRLKRTSRVPVVVVRDDE